MKRRDGIAKPAGVTAFAVVHNPTASGGGVAKPKGVGIGRGKERWTKNLRDLGDEARAMFERGEIPEADNSDDAIRIMCARFVNKNGRPIDAKNLIDNLNSRKRAKGF